LGPRCEGRRIDHFFISVWFISQPRQSVSVRPSDNCHLQLNAPRRRRACRQARSNT
jgi:hypothetical protein